MNLYYWFLATLIVDSFCVYHFISESVPNFKYRYKEECLSFSFRNKVDFNSASYDTITASNSIHKTTLLSAKDLPTQISRDYINVDKWLINFKT